MEEKSEELQAAAAKLHLASAKRHVFLCTGPSCCTPEEGQKAWEALKQHIKAHQLTSCNRNKVGCLRICCHGPTMLVYPEGTWYHGMTSERIPEFVRRHLIEGQPVQEWVFARNPLGQVEQEP